MRRPLVPTLLLALLPVLGCKSTGVVDTASALDGAYGTALQIGRATSTLLPTLQLPQEGPHTYREKMLDYAGPGHFRNDAMGETRERMKADANNYQQVRQNFTNAQFQQQRASFQGGSDVPARGSVKEQVMGVPNPLGDGKLLFPTPNTVLNRIIAQQVGTVTGAR